MLRRREAFFFLLAIIVAVTREGACVGWRFGRARSNSMSDSSRNFVGEWTGLALPQGWLLGALLVLIYRVTAMFIPPRRWTDHEFLQNRRSFLRLWRWAIALVAMQGLALFLGRATAAS